MNGKHLKLDHAGCVGFREREREWDKVYLGDTEKVSGLVQKDSVGEACRCDSEAMVLGLEYQLQSV